MKYTELRKLVQEKVKNRETFSAQSIHQEQTDKTSIHRIAKNLLTLYDRGEMQNYRIMFIDFENRTTAYYYYPDMPLLEALKIFWKGIWSG